MCSYLSKITSMVCARDCNRHRHQWDLNFLAGNWSFWSSLHTLSGKLSYPYLFESQRGAKLQNFEFLLLGAVQTLTSRKSLMNIKTISHILWPSETITINTCRSLNQNNVVPTVEWLSCKLSWAIFQLGQECTMYVQWFTWHFFVKIAQTLFNQDVPLLLGQERKFKE